MSNLAYKDRELLDPKTGELLTVEQIALEYIKETYHEEEKKKEKIKKYLKLKKSKDELHILIKEECGSFFFNKYESLLNKEHLFRFIYLCTYMNYDNVLVFGRSKDVELQKATKKDLQEILGLKNPQFYATINYLVENKMLIINEHEIKINDKICIRGQLKQNEKGVVRMFDDAVKELYNKAKPSEHSKLGLLIRLLPYIHIGSNIISRNPLEEDIDKVIPFSLTELAKEFKYSTTQKLRKGLMDLKINEESLIMVATINRKNMIVVNPRLYYKGNNIGNLTGVINLFRIADSKRFGQLNNKFNI